MSARRIAAALLLVGLLSGCGDGAGGQYLDVVVVDLPDGGQVTCVSQEHGLDCDWGNR